MKLQIELEVRGDKNKLTVGQPFSLDALRELLTLTPKQRERDYGKAADTLLHLAMGFAMKAGDDGVDKLLAPFREPQPFEMRLCEQNHVLLKPDKLYLFTVDPECPHCKAIAEKAKAPNEP